MCGAEWRSRKLIKSIPEMLVWPASVKQMDEGSRNLWLSSLLTEADGLLPEFLDNLWHRCGGDKKNLLRLNTTDGNMVDRLIDFSKSISRSKKVPSLPKEEREKLEAVDAVLNSLERYFRCLNEEPAKDRKMLMADERGPGLPIIVWSAGKKRKTLLSKSLEFDCQGSITALSSSSPVKGAHGTDRDESNPQILVQCGEIKSSYANREKAIDQPEIPLQTMQRVLDLTLGHSVMKFQLLGFIFYNKNGKPVDKESDGDEFTGNVMIKFIELK